MELKKLKTDIAIIGGGTAGCYAAISLARSGLDTVLIEKAEPERSGCLAAGVNAINAYIGQGHVPEDYVDYAIRDAHGIARRDLLLTMSQRLNRMVEVLEKLGLTIQKEDGRYATRGWRNVKINGENIKPLLARAVRSGPTRVLSRLNAVAYAVVDGTIAGVVALSTERPEVYLIEATAVICATGGAAGLYRPNNPGSTAHQMWYCPFNTGAGYAMGITAGAEMTTLEMRFVALRCRDTIAPTGTLAVGAGARQLNALGQSYEDKYGYTTSQRVFGTLSEELAGRGPCRLETEEVLPLVREDIYRAYLNMAPAQTLRWLEQDWDRKVQDSRLSVQIEGTEPYIVGGHTAAGYWVDTHRQTTISGLYAAGDVAGGCPQKYVSGAMAEAEIAADAALEYVRNHCCPRGGESLAREILAEARVFLSAVSTYSCRELEEAMQKTMDTLAGGLSTHYRYSQAELTAARERLLEISGLSQRLSARNPRELLGIYELKDRLVLGQTLLAHLLARKETRWPGFASFSDYPEQDDQFCCHVNSITRNGEAEIILRPLVEGNFYEHQ